MPGAGDVTPEQFGAVGDGRSDDTAAVQRALSGLRAGQRLVLAAGRTYQHSDVLRLTVPGTSLVGGGTLRATRPERSALDVDADDVTIDGVTLASVPADRRYLAYEQMKLRSSNHRGLTVSNVTIERSAAAGIFLEGASDFTIRDVVVNDTKADGIHMTGGSHDGTVTRATVNRSGDDGVAVVSYSSDPRTSSRITVTSPVINDQVWGRGVSVVGGEDVTYRDVKVNRSAGAAVYIASEGDPYYTRSVARVMVDGATITRGNALTSIGHGAVLLFGGRSETSVTSVTVQNVSVLDPPGTGGSAVNLRCSAGSAVSGIRLQGIRVDRGYYSPFSSTCANSPGVDVAFR